MQTYSLQVGLLVAVTAWISLIGPETLGISGAFYAMIALPIAVLDAGLVSAIVTRDRLLSQDLRAISAQQTLIGFLLAILLGLFAIVVEPSVGGLSIKFLLLVFACCMPILALSKLRLTVFYRNLKADRLAYIRWFGLIIRYAVALGIWLISTSLLSLAIGVLASIVLESLLVVLFWRNEEVVGFAIPRKHEFIELPARLLGAGEQLVAEFRRQVDLMVLTPFVSPDVLGGYAYLSRLLLQARDTLLSPLSSIMLAAYAKIKGRTQLVKRIYLDQQRLLANTLVPALLLFGAGFQLFGGKLLPKIEQIVEYGILISLFPACSVFTYMSGALLYGYREFKRMVLYGIFFAIALFLAYLSIVLVSFANMLTLVVGVWYLGIFLNYNYMLKQIGLLSIKVYFQAIIYPLIALVIVFVVDFQLSTSSSAAFTVILSLCWLLIGVYESRQQLFQMMNRLLKRP